ncbi:MAG: hypothetical protein U9R75_09820 [Candidatus Thermoplasmatota archaeon]|nr:hypothetical protein [Candidatus Thermoplasmatota archaeon]
MTAITENLHIVIMGILTLIVILYALYTVISIIKRRIKVRDASREVAILKMDLLSKQAHLENLIEDSVQWSRKDLRDYDETMKDNKVLKSRMDTKMQVSDTKVKRLELMNETAELFETLEKIKVYEDKVFDGKNGRRSG